MGGGFPIDRAGEQSWDGVAETFHVVIGSPRSSFVAPLEIVAVMPPVSPKSNLRSAQRAIDFRHFLCRAHTYCDSAHCHLPEVLTTDGRVVRRMASIPKQIVFQEFTHAETAAALIGRIEQSGVSGMPVVGYSMFEEHDAVAILRTGSSIESGWLAFPDSGIIGSSHPSPTLPVEVANFPKLRLVAGAHLTWERRGFHVHAALEQRGSEFMATHAAFDALSHVEAWEVFASIERKGRSELIPCVAVDVVPEITRTADALRLETSFPIESNIYKELRAQGATFSFGLRFDPYLFCLPEGWRRFWIEVDIHEPAGLMT